MLIAVDCLKNAKKHLLWSATIDKLVKKYWPGPLTIVGRCVNPMLVRGVVSEAKEVAVRIPGNKLFRKIIEMSCRPIVATSANVSGEREIYDSKEAFEIFSKLKDYPDKVMNFGRIPKNIPTTVIRVDAFTDEITILRQGVITPNLDVSKMQKYFGRFVKKRI
jgi:L-threonylcarbamoyladenylate synthase